MFSPPSAFTCSPVLYKPCHHTAAPRASSEDHDCHDMFDVDYYRDKTAQDFVEAPQQKYKTEYVLQHNKMSFFLRGFNMYEGPYPNVASADETD